MHYSLVFLGEFRTDDIFNFEVPVELPGVEKDVCNPRESWEDKSAYDVQAKKLAKMFQENYLQYTGDGVEDYSMHGPKML